MISQRNKYDGQVIESPSEKNKSTMNGMFVQEKRSERRKNDSTYQISSNLGIMKWVFPCMRWRDRLEEEEEEKVPRSFLFDSAVLFLL